MTPQGKFGQPKFKTLVVEDDSSIRTLITGVLESDSHLVSAAMDGDQAIEFLSREQFDLVVLDVMMPRRDGYEVLRYLRSTESRNSVPVVMLTALGSDEHWVKGLQSGAHAYLTKPFDPDELAELVRSLLMMSSQERTEIRDRELERSRLLARLDQTLHRRSGSSFPEAGGPMPPSR